MADNPITQTDQFVFFWRGWPSQWVPSPFTLDAVAYSCCEQYMMAEKARVFGDDRTLCGILAATSPRKQKDLGRQARGFDEALWNSVCRGIVFTGNLAKFQQNADLRAQLLDTGGRVIVEASPVDCIWGIGLAADNPEAILPDKWPGKNWLGIALMQVRDALRFPSAQLAPELLMQLENRKRLTAKPVASTIQGRQP